VAGPDDPAPEGAVVYGIALRGACLIGYLPSDRLPHDTRVVGPLPDGRCLSA
jgi:hypothetical protein